MAKLIRESLQYICVNAP